MIINTGQRTDIPAFYAPWLLRRLEEGFVMVRNPFKPQQITRYRLSPEVVDCIGFITKNPAPLLPHMAAAGVDVIESISPPPTGNIDIADAFALLPQHVALIGGIEPVFFQNCTAEELDARTDALLQMTAGRRYVLANSDSCPPAVEEWKFRRVTGRVRGTR